MKKWKSDRSGGILSAAATLIVLFVLACAASVLFPNEWHELTRLASNIWADIQNILEQAWTMLQGFFSRLLGTI